MECRKGQIPMSVCYGKTALARHGLTASQQPREVKTMTIWSRLFGGRSKANAASAGQVRQSAPSTANCDDKVGVTVSGVSGNMEPMLREAMVTETLRYDGGAVEPFYERMSRDLVARHGPLVGVDYSSHFPKFEIWFSYKDGARIYSGERRGQFDIHFLSLGYVGEGPRYAHHFLSAAGFDLSSEQIESIKPGDSIQIKDGRAEIVREKDKVVETAEVTFEREVKANSMGLPAIYRLYKGPNRAAATAFLEKQNITAPSYFVGVKTPEGTFCKDRMGLFDAPTPNWPN